MENKWLIQFNKIFSILSIKVARWDIMESQLLRDTSSISDYASKEGVYISNMDYTDPVPLPKRSSHLSTFMPSWNALVVQGLSPRPLPTKEPTGQLEWSIEVCPARLSLTLRYWDALLCLINSRGFEWLTTQIIRTAISINDITGNCIPTHDLWERIMVIMVQSWSDILEVAYYAQFPSINIQDPKNLQ